MSSRAPQAVDLVVYEVAHQRFASPLSEVARIAADWRHDDERPRCLAEVLTGRAGWLSPESRVLITTPEAGATRFLVDAVHEMISIPVARLVPMPKYVAHDARRGLAWGVAILPDDELIIVVELRRLIATPSEINAIRINEQGVKA